MSEDCFWSSESVARGLLPIQLLANEIERMTTEEMCNLFARPIPQDTGDKE